MEDKCWFSTTWEKIYTHTLSYIETKRKQHWWHSEFRHMNSLDNHDYLIRYGIIYRLSNHCAFTFHDSKQCTRNSVRMLHLDVQMLCTAIDKRDWNAFYSWTHWSLLMGNLRRGYSHHIISPVSPSLYVRVCVYMDIENPFFTTSGGLVFQCLRKCVRECLQSSTVNIQPNTRIY